MIIPSYVVTLWALLFASCGPTVAQSVAVFDFELIDTSLESAIRGARPDEQERLARLSDRLRQLLRDSSRFSLVDITPIAREAQASNLQGCGGCDMRLARRIGAERDHRHRAKGIEPDPQHEHLRSRRLVRSNHCGHERGHARQYRRDVVTRARLAGSQSASRAWLWPPALSELNNARRGTPNDERGPRCGSIVRVALHDFGRGGGSASRPQGVGTAIIAESIFFQWTFERRGKILEKLPLW